MTDPVPICPVCSTPLGRKEPAVAVRVFPPLVVPLVALPDWVPTRARRPRELWACSRACADVLYQWGTIRQHGRGAADLPDD